MTGQIVTLTSQRRIKARQVALPTEHGSWGFLFEPLVAGLIIAPSLAAPWIAGMVISIFLLRRPLLILTADWLANRSMPQTVMAIKFSLLYSLIFCISVLGAASYTDSESFIPFILVIPVAIFQFYSGLAKQSRGLFAELSGAIAISSSVAVLLLAAGRPVPMAMAIWAVFIARIVPSIIYVRNRLYLEKGKGYSTKSTTIAHFAALALVGALAYMGLIPVLPVVVMTILLYRAIAGLLPGQKRLRAAQIGIRELIYGALTVLSVVVGHYFGP